MTEARMESHGGRGGKVMRIAGAVLGGGVALACLASLAAINAAKRTEREAERFLHDFLELQAGISTLRDAERLGARYAAFKRDIAGPRPDDIPGHTRFDFWFENTWLHRLHLAPRTVFWAILGLRNGRITERDVEFGSEVADYGPGVGVWDLEVLPSGKPYEVRDQKWLIELTPQATPAQRQRSFALNLKCLSKLGGCKDREEFLPGVWPPRPGG